MEPIFRGRQRGHFAAARSRCAGRTTSIVPALIWLITSGAGLVICQGATDQIRRYVLLVDALELDRTGRTPTYETLAIEWLQPIDSPAPPQVESVRRHVPKGAELSRKDCKVTLDADSFSGELQLSAARDYRAGSWRFSGSLSMASGDGVYETVRKDGAHHGRVSILTTYDVGNLNHGALRLWLPAGEEQVRGILVWGNGGRNDDRYEVIRDLWVGFCRLHRFALVAMGGYGADLGGGDGRVFSRQLEELSLRTKHPELVTVPVLFTGHSNGGIKAWEFNALYPERVLGFTVSKAANPGMARASDEARANPALLVIGENDRAESNSALYRLFTSNRPKGAPWAFLAEPNGGHGLGHLPHLWLPYFDWIVQTRLPPDASAIQPVDPVSGWRIVHRGAKPGENAFGRADEITAAAGNTSWLPNEAVLFAYLGMAAPENTLDLTITPQRGRFLIGESVNLRVEDFSAARWSAAQLIVNGQFACRLTPELRTALLPCERLGVFVASVVARPPDGGAFRVSRPVAWVVENDYIPSSRRASSDME